MNYLPHHRRALYGRTHPRAWRPEDFAPIERPAPRRVWPWFIVTAAIVTAAVWRVL